MQINKWGCVPIKPCTERWQAGFLGPVICWFLLFMAKVWFNMAIHHYIYILKNLTKQGVSSLQSIDIFGFGSDMKNSWVHIKSQIFIFLWKKIKNWRAENPGPEWTGVEYSVLFSSEGLGALQMFPQPVCSQFPRACLITSRPTLWALELRPIRIAKSKLILSPNAIP